MDKTSRNYASRKSMKTSIDEVLRDHQAHDETDLECVNSKLALTYGEKIEGGLFRIYLRSLLKEKLAEIRPK